MERLVIIDLLWRDAVDDCTFYGSIVVEANLNQRKPIANACATADRLLLKLPDAGVVDRAVALSPRPWAPGELRTVGPVTIAAPTGREGSKAMLTWTGSDGAVGNLWATREDWLTTLRTALQDRFDGNQLTTAFIAAGRPRNGNVRFTLRDGRTQIERPAQIVISPPFSATGSTER
jgi:hypothetical protein